ncbi:MAG TPA: hypothetical protein VF510_15465 [Ktedonobacterales bacterium]
MVAGDLAGSIAGAIAAGGVTPLIAEWKCGGDAVDIAVLAGIIAGMFAGTIADVGYAARVLIFSGDRVAAASESLRERRRGVLPFLPLFRFLMVRGWLLAY